VSRDRLGTRTPSDAPAPAPARNPAVTFAAIAVAVVAVVVGVSVLFGRGGDDPEDTPTTVASQSGDLALSVPNTPTIEAVGVTGGVKFTWQYLAPEKADRFFLRTASGTSALASAIDGAPLAASTHTVKARKGAVVCGQVKVSREGPTSDYSTPQCGRAK